MGTISVDIDIEDFIDEIDDIDMIVELKSRGYVVTGGKKNLDIDLTYLQTKLDTREKLLKALYTVMGLKPWHYNDKQRLLAEIENLF